MNSRPLVISSDNSDTASLSSDDDSDAPGKLVTASARTVKSKSPLSKRKMVTTQAKGKLRAVNRKRGCTISDDDTVSLVKKSRTNIDPMCAAINNIELERPHFEDARGSDVSDDRKYSRIEEVRRGKSATASDSGHASITNSSHEDVVGGSTLDEQVVSGRIHKDEVSQILFRFPDGVRLQKTFLSSNLIRVSSYVYLLIV